MLWQTLPCCYFLIQCGRVLLSTRDQTLSKHSVKLLVLQGNIWCVCQIKLQRFALVWKNTLVTAVFWLLWLTYKSLWPQGLAACSLTLSSHNPSLSLHLFFFSPPSLYVLDVFARYGSGTWTSPWHLRSSQKWSRRAGTSGPGRAAPPRPPDRTLSSLARRTASAGLKFKKKKKEEAGEFSWQLSLAVNVAFFSKVITQNVQQKGRENMPENAPQALRKRRAVQRRTPSPRRSAYTSRTPPWTSITGVRDTKRAAEDEEGRWGGRWNHYLCHFQIRDCTETMREGDGLMKGGVWRVLLFAFWLKAGIYWFMSCFFFCETSWKKQITEWFRHNVTQSKSISFFSHGL